MPAEEAVVEVSAQFADAPGAKAAADALNRWFRWIVEGSADPVPPLFEPFGVDTKDYAWALDEDVDWELGPHARAAGPEVRVALQTRDTHLRVAGLLRALGAKTTKITRER
jgi:hypothetical protein